MLLYLITFVTFGTCLGTLCPKQCDCDMDNGLNRALCVDQNIVSVDVGVPKEVQVYSLRRNVISELENFCFQEVGFTNLRTLDLSYNLIFWIGLHAFSGLGQLVSLDLSDNRLRYIPSDLFWDTPELDILDLSSNIFEKLKNEPFIMHNKLQVLNLNNCRIKSLPERLFTRLPNLRKIDLGENYMVTLNLNVLMPLRKLERIELRNEYWKCNPDFEAVETWISSHNIKYTKQCHKKLPNMFEKMISMTVERENVDVDKVWNITIKNNTLLEAKTNKTDPLSPYQKFDKKFSAVQAFIIGLEVGLAIGIVGTYIWLRRFCSCSRQTCRRRHTRQRRRQRGEGDMRATLLWSSPDSETPPYHRRQLSLPDRSPPFPGNGIAGLHIDAVRVNRAETPPPPYNDCRLNV